MGANVLSERKVRRVAAEIDMDVDRAFVRDNHHIHLRVVPTDSLPHAHFIYHRRTNSLYWSKEHWTSCWDTYPQDMRSIQIRYIGEKHGVVK